MNVQPEQALTLAAIMAEGTFDAAAHRLHLTPSAVSQRVRALEMAIGRPVLRRVRPVELTPAGEAVVRFARQLELLSADLSDQFEPSADGSTPRITLVVNGDSLHTWALPGLVEVADRVQLTILREDQDHSLDLLRRGTAHGAVTATAAPVAGCTSRAAGRDALPTGLHPRFRRPLVRRRRQPHDTRHRPGRHLRRQGRPAGPLPQALIAAQACSHHGTTFRLPTNSAKPSSSDSAGECCPNCSSHNWSPEH